MKYFNPREAVRQHVINIMTLTGAGGKEEEEREGGERSKRG
jgi:hypothetical protein